HGSCFPSRSLNLYAPFPSASVTSYGPSHLGPSFLVSSTLLASLLRYTRRSRLISKASLFCTRSTFAVLSVGMPISIGITASVQYVNENGVSPLLDFIMLRLRFALSTRPLVYEPDILGTLLSVPLRLYAW
ncbi:hypothetical protein Tco_0897534, partial [Tanacetum coccineum]